MEWILIIIWLSIINGGQGRQYVLNWMANQPDFTGGRKIDVSPGIMTWWREISKLAWAVVTVITELIRGKKLNISGLKQKKVVRCSLIRLRRRYKDI